MSYTLDELITLTWDEDDILESDAINDILNIK